MPVVDLVPGKLAPSKISLAICVVPAALVATFYSYLVMLGSNASGDPRSTAGLILPFLFSFLAAYLLLLAAFVLLKFLYIAFSGGFRRPSA